MSLPTASLNLSILTSGLYPEGSPYAALTAGFGIGLAVTPRPLNAFESSPNTLAQSILLAAAEGLDLAVALAGGGMPLVAPSGLTLGSKPSGSTVRTITHPPVTSVT